MLVRIEIDTSNAAFKDDPGELPRILHNIAERFDTYGPEHVGRVAAAQALYDANGNRVGTVLDGGGLAMPRMMFTAERDGHPVAIDSAVRDDSGEWRGVYGGRTLAEIQTEDPGAQLETLEAFAQRQDAAYRVPPTRCTQEDFDYMLGVLPPEGWTRDSFGQSFKISERTCGAITPIYAQTADGQCWTLQDDFTLTHAEIMRRIEEAINNV